MPRWARNSFRGINEDRAEHLLAEGFVADLRNLLARGGMLRTRRGWMRATDATDEIGPSGVDQWPNLIFSFDPEGLGGDERAKVPAPEEPYGSVETPPDPIADNGSNIIDVVSPDTGGSILLPDPDGGDATLPIQASLPGIVYDRCRFVLRFACSGFDGSGAETSAWLIDAAGVFSTPALNLDPAVTSGWADGLWEGTARVDGAADDVALVVKASAGQRQGVIASASFELPSFSVALPTAAEAGEEITVTVECQQAGYEGGGHGLALSFQRWAADSEEWLALGTSGLASIGEGWADGLWSDTFELGNLQGSTLVRAVLAYPGRGGDATVYAEMPVSLAEYTAAILPADVYADEPFDLLLSALDGAGNAIPNFAASRISLLWEIGSSETGPWAELTGVYAIDPIGETWVDGTATLAVQLSTEMLQEDSWLRVTVLLDGIPNSEDVARLDVVALEENILAAIYERQQAAGVPNESLINLEGTYNLSQLCTEANKFTGWDPGNPTFHWLDPESPWTDKTALPATVLDNSYFGLVDSGATAEVADLAALFAGVVAFRKGRVTVPEYGPFGTRILREGEATGSPATFDYVEGEWVVVTPQTPWSEIKSDAEDDWQQSGTNGLTGVWTGLALLGQYWTPSAYAMAFNREDLGCEDTFDTRRARTLSLWIKAKKAGDHDPESGYPTYSTFAAFGCGVVEGEYAQVSSNARGAGEANELPGIRWTGYPAFPSPWPTPEPDSNVHTEDNPDVGSSRRGWLADGWNVVVCEWSFDW